MDDFCASQHPICVRPGDNACEYAGTVCNARFTPIVGNADYTWRCLTNGAMDDGGQVWDRESKCLYSGSRDELMVIALRYPVLGDFEKQLWLDTFCQNQDVSGGCSEPYFAQYNATLHELICRSVETTSSTCPVKNGAHTDLFNMMTRGMAIHTSNFILGI